MRIRMVMIRLNAKVIQPKILILQMGFTYPQIWKIVFKNLIKCFALKPSKK